MRILVIKTALTRQVVRQVVPQVVRHFIQLYLFLVMSSFFDTSPFSSSTVWDAQRALVEIIETEIEVHKDRKETEKLGKYVLI